MSPQSQLAADWWRGLRARRALIGYVAGATALLAMLGVLAVYLLFRASLPRLSGVEGHAGLGASTTLERDQHGVPTLIAKSRRDLAFATGYAHAQDRFFQMDLMRRAAAGELAELLGPSVLASDRRLRVHGFSHIAAEVIAQSPAGDRDLLAAYCDGVNAALESLDARPWEYFLLRVRPRPWRSEDSILVAFSMYLNLNDSTGSDEIARGILRSALPAEVYDFIHPFGTEWDAPMTGGTWRAPAIPRAEIFDLRRQRGEDAQIAVLSFAAEFEELAAGSNSWAVAGSHTQDGRALLANDMHLTLRLPHIWYRARMIVTGDEVSQRDLIGVTLPGLPVLIAGSNGRVAWGYTNSYGDWTDVVRVEPDSGDTSRYRVGESLRSFGNRTEEIRVRGANASTLRVQTTQWGPIIERDTDGAMLALAWTAHQPVATNLRMLDFEDAQNVEQLLDAANRAGGPVQNVIAADDQGNIGWSVMGRVPVRAGYDSTRPASHQAPDVGWVGWRAPEEYPRIVNPSTGRLWTANTRTVGAQLWLDFMGDGGHDLGARSGQIRDALFALPQASAEQMSKLQLDDRALFLMRWRDLLLELLTDAAVKGHAQRAEARGLVANWTGRASAADAGYAVVRAFRLRTRDRVFAAITAQAQQRNPQRRFRPSNQFEGPLWQLVTQRPQHWLEARYGRWEDALLSWLDESLAAMIEECDELARCGWGRLNRLNMRHPLSSALPWSTRWLDMPGQDMSGDVHMPRVQGRDFGASQRLVISPGRESAGLFQMPGGQVGHPLSPFYGAGHDAWVKGEPSSLLPGETRYTLRLTPTR